MTDHKSIRPFMRALAEALRDTKHPAVTDDGNVNWAIFARDLPRMHYETLRKIRSGDRQLDAAAIEEISTAAGVDPTYFAEYRLIKARESFDPRVVGLDQALKNLEAWKGPGPKASAVARPRPASAT